jgi:hypothetical protein
LRVFFLLAAFVGEHAGDGGATQFSVSRNGYVAGMAYWDNAGISDAGAVTWGSARGGLTGPISAVNSLVGDSPNQNVGGWVTRIGEGVYALQNQTGLTLAHDNMPLSGVPNSENTAFGVAPHHPRSYSYDSTHDRLVIGWVGGVVTLFQRDVVFLGGFE